jgi:PKD repeat protein
MRGYSKPCGMTMKGLVIYVVCILAFGFSLPSQAEPVLALSVSGQAQPQLTDPADNMLGANATTGQLERGIANARLSLGASSSYMTIPNPLTGSYSIILNGSFEENLMVRLSYSDSATGVYQELPLQTLFHGTPIAFSVALDPANVNPLIVIPPAGLPTEPDIQDNAGSARLIWTPATDSQVTKYRIYARLQQYSRFQALGVSTVPFYDTVHPVRFDETGDHWKYIIVGLTDDGRESFYTTILNNQIVLAAFFDTDTQAGTAPLTVTFSDDSIGNPASWAWDFENDGVVDSTEQNPVHTYENNGKYTVRLSVMGMLGTDDVEQTDYINVSSESTPSDDDGDGVADVDDAFPLDASESVDTDSDGIGNNADTDDDGDGVADADDAFPLDVSNSSEGGGSVVGINFDGAAVPHCDDGTTTNVNNHDNGTYYCDFAAGSSANDIYIASGFTVQMKTGQNPLNAASAILGANGKLEGNLVSASTVAMGAGATINGNVESGTTVAMGVEAVVTGDADLLDRLNTHADGSNLAIYAGSTLALGANATVDGAVQAVTTIAVGAEGSVVGNVYAGTTVALGANSSVTGDVTAGTTVALGADSHVNGDVASTTSTVTLGVNSYVTGTTKALKAGATLGAGAYACKTVEAVTATLGAGSFVRGDLLATTMTVAAGSFVTEGMFGTTATLGADACYGTLIVATTITLGAGAGQCSPAIPAGSCP